MQRPPKKEQQEQETYGDIARFAALSLQARSRHIDEIRARFFPMRSYVVRNTRTSERQKMLFAQALETMGIACELGKSLIDSLPEEQARGKNLQAEAVREKKLCLDIGFGSGESLVRLAEREPETLFVGIETYRQGIANAFGRAEEAGVSNIRFMCADAVQVLLAMAPRGAISRIQVFFPDPWHKARHHKRRLLRAPFLRLCREVLIPGGFLWMVTDWQDYAMSIEEAMEGEHLRGLFERVDASALEALREESRFERRGKLRNHAIYPLVYRRI